MKPDKGRWAGGATRARRAGAGGPVDPDGCHGEEGQTSVLSRLRSAQWKPVYTVRTPSQVNRAGDWRLPRSRRARWCARAIPLIESTPAISGHADAEPRACWSAISGRFWAGKDGSVDRYRDAWARNAIPSRSRMTSRRSCCTAGGDGGRTIMERVGGVRPGYSLGIVNTAPIAGSRVGLRAGLSRHVVQGFWTTNACW